MNQTEHEPMTQALSGILPDASETGCNSKYWHSKGEQFEHFGGLRR